tara:strand:+ start:181 stop:705 length:525 start_codon:yes stop_codon:yes gene_type:complete
MKKHCKILIILFTVSKLCFAGFPVTEKKSSIDFDVECDNIILNDGSEISSKIIEITPDLIKYRKCSNLEGPLISISRSSILMIRYADGTKDIMNLDKRIQDKDIYDTENPRLSLGFLSIFLGLLSWFVLGVVFAPAGIILGVISSVIDKNKVPGIIGLLISSIAFIILLAALSL